MEIDEKIFSSKRENRKDRENRENRENRKALSLLFLLSLFYCPRAFVVEFPNDKNSDKRAYFRRTRKRPPRIVTYVRRSFIAVQRQRRRLYAFLADVDKLIHQHLNHFGIVAELFAEISVFVRA